MMESDFEHFNARIERLEGKLRRRTTGAIIAALVCVSASMLIGQTPSPKRVVEADQFILKGPNGEELASLDSVGIGARFAFYDNAHHTRLVLGFAHDMASISMMDQGEQIRAGMVSSDEGTGLAFTGSDLKSQASIFVKNNYPQFQIYDGGGKVRAELSEVATGPALRLWNSRQELGAAVAMADDLPMVSVTGNLGRSGVSLWGVKPGTTNKVGSIILFDSDGKTILWSARPILPN